MTKKTFIKSVSLVLALNVLGKAAGFLKQIVLAAFFGANSETDILFTSYFFINEISATIFTSAGVVLLTLYGKQKARGQKIDELFSSILKIVIGISIIIIGLIVLFSDYVAIVIAPGYNIEMRTEVSKYVKLLSPIILIYGTIILKNSILEYEKKFLPTKTLNIILNTLIIIATLLFSGNHGIFAVMIGIIAAYVLQYAISSIATKKYTSFSIKKSTNKNELGQFLKLYLPMLLSTAIIEINSIVDRSIASNLEEGSVSAITYGASINEIVTVLIIGSIGQVLYSYIASMTNKKAPKEVKKYVLQVIERMIYILVPICIIVAFCANDIAKIIFMRGNFDENNAIKTAYVILGYSIGYIPFMIRTILLKAQYAYQDSKSVLCNGIITVACNIILSIVLSNIVGVIGIPIATSVSYISSMVYCYIKAKKILNIKKQDIPYIRILRLVPYVIISICALLVINNTFTLNNYLSIIITVLLTIPPYLIYAKLLKVFNIKELMQMQDSQ